MVERKITKRKKRKNSQNINKRKNRKIKSKNRKIKSKNRNKRKNKRTNKRYNKKSKIYKGGLPGTGLAWNLGVVDSLLKKKKDDGIIKSLFHKLEGEGVEPQETPCERLLQCGERFIRDFNLKYNELLQKYNAVMVGIEEERRKKNTDDVVLKINQRIDGLDTEINTIEKDNEGLLNVFIDLLSVDSNKELFRKKLWDAMYPKTTQEFEDDIDEQIKNLIKGLLLSNSYESNSLRCSLRLLLHYKIQRGGDLCPLWEKYVFSKLSWNDDPDTISLGALVEYINDIMVSLYINIESYKQLLVFITTLEILQPDFVIEIQREIDIMEGSLYFLKGILEHDFEFDSGEIDKALSNSRGEDMFELLDSKGGTYPSWLKLPEVQIKELQAMKFDAVKDRAAAAGIDADNVKATLDGAGDPKTKLIERIVEGSSFRGQRRLKILTILERLEKIKTLPSIKYSKLFNSVFEGFEQITGPIERYYLNYNKIIMLNNQKEYLMRILSDYLSLNPQLDRAREEEPPQGGKFKKKVTKKNMKGGDLLLTFLLVNDIISWLTIPILLNADSENNTFAMKLYNTIFIFASSSPNEIKKLFSSYLWLNRKIINRKLLVQLDKKEGDDANKRFLEGILNDVNNDGLSESDKEDFFFNNATEAAKYIRCRWGVPEPELTGQWKWDGRVRWFTSLMPLEEIAEELEGQEGKEGMVVLRTTRLFEPPNRLLVDNQPIDFTLGYCHSGMQALHYCGNVVKTEPIHADKGLTNGEALKGAVALAHSGEVLFSKKAINAANAGAVALIVINENEALLCPDQYENPTEETPIPVLTVANSVEGELVKGKVVLDLREVKQRGGMYWSAIEKKVNLREPENVLRKAVEKVKAAQSELLAARSGGWEKASAKAEKSVEKAQTQWEAQYNSMWPVKDFGGRLSSPNPISSCLYKIEKNPPFILLILFMVLMLIKMHEIIESKTAYRDNLSEEVGVAAVGGRGKQSKE